MRRGSPLLLVLVVLFAALPVGGCHVHQHRVGGGPVGAGEDSMRQYYLLFGLVSLNEVDSQRMTRDLTSYEITTEFGWTDVLLLPLLLPLTVTTRTVTVTR